MMKRRFIKYLLLLCAVLLPFSVQGERFGNLNRESEVFTPADDIVASSVSTRDGYPVFEIRVPSGYTEVQVRASVTNFEPGFLFVTDGTPIFNFIPTGETVGGKKKFRALTTQYFAAWNATAARWEIQFEANRVLHATTDCEFPWDIDGDDISIEYIVEPTEPSPTVEDPIITLPIEYFVYRTCTTGIAADETWGTGSSDPDPKVFFASQVGGGGGAEFQRTDWDKATSLTSQLNITPTPWSPGYTVLFQPSRGALGADEWMQENVDNLIWIYQVENTEGKPKQPDNSDIWNIMTPAAWRKARLSLTAQ